MTKQMQTNSEIGLQARDARTRTLERLRRAIEGGRLARNGRLPPERELAAELRIGRSTLRKALAALEAEGRIWRHVGRGTFVGSRPAEPGPAFALHMRPSSPAEVMEVRLTFEPLIAGLAALRASPAEIAYMRRCLAKSETAPDWQTYELWDSSLHRAIAEATRNALMLTFLETINSLRQQTDWGRMRQVSLTPSWQRIYAGQHAGVVDAIEARDSRAAAASMRRHLETVQSSLFDAADAGHPESDSA